MLNKIKLTLLINSLFFSLSFSQSWETIGGNSARTSFLNVVGPQKKPKILWEGSLPSGGGFPILISDNKLVTMRTDDPNWEIAPIVCHDLFTGDTLWTLDFEGGYHSTSIPVGFKNNTIYAINWFGDALKGDTLYAINADNGEIIWHSDFYIVNIYIEGVVFTENNDLIVSGYPYIARVNNKNGDTLWSIGRHVPSLPAWCGLAILEETVYGWEGVYGEDFSIIAIDVKTGNIKYKKAIPTAGSFLLDATTIPVVSKDRIIYALRPENNLVALKDNGDSLLILWNIPIIDGGYSKPAIGPDESVYFTNHKKIMRASPEGKIIDSSIIIQSEDVQYQNGYFAIDATGTIYFNNNTNNGVLFSFTKDLKLIWTDTLKGLCHGGPALGPQGLLAIAGADNILKVYKPENLSSNDKILYNLKPQVSYITSPKYVSFRYYVQYYTNLRLILYNTRGQQIYTYENMPNSPGFHCVNIKGINENYGNGRFIYQLIIGNKSISNTISIVK